MSRPANVAIVTAHRSTWRTYAERLQRAELFADLNYITNQVGCWRGDFPSVPMTADRLATYQRLMDPMCAACGLGPTWHDDGACPEPAESEVA